MFGRIFVEGQISGRRDGRRIIESPIVNRDLATERRLQLVMAGIFQQSHGHRLATTLGSGVLHGSHVNIHIGRASGDDEIRGS